VFSFFLSFFLFSSASQPDTVPGDVVVVLQQSEHSTFKRDGPNLIMEKKIALVEALCGFSFYVKHLDRRTLVVRSEPGIVYTPGDVKAVLSEGMPSRNNPMLKGNLYIKFVIEFPKSGTLSAAHMKVWHVVSNKHVFFSSSFSCSVCVSMFF
jgi:DnaJ family protein A protein 2